MTATPLDLLVVGDVNPDLVLRAEDARPAFGQAETLVDGATLTVGSSAAIVACGAARLGLRTGLIGTVGDDLFGRFMLAELRARGVDTGACVVSGRSATGISVILSQPHDRAILTYRGAMSELGYDDIDQGQVARARHLHVSSLFLLDGLRDHLPRLFAAAKDLGLSTSLDTNWDPAAEWRLDLAGTLADVDVLFPNEAEAMHLTGAATLDEALARLGEHVALTVVKLGARGSVAQRRGAPGGARRGERAGERHSAPPLSVEPVDTTGAGDSFAAGFLYGRLKGWDVPASLRFASVCGSLSTRAAGGTEAQATEAEALAALTRLGVSSPA